MATFESFDGLKLAYEVEGAGVPVLLLHGFASSSFVNWVRPGITDDLVRAGYRTIALDQRGHGSSGKPHEESAYADGAMARDAQALLDHMGVSSCLAVGYSMGARNTLALISRDERIRAAVLGGIGSNMLRARDWGSVVADGLLADDKSTITHRIAKSFRDFADLTKADRVALASIMRNTREPLLEEVNSVHIPVLVLCGDNDPLVGTPTELAGAIPGARAVVVGGTHLNVLNNPEFRREVLKFLDEHRDAVGEG